MTTVISLLAHTVIAIVLLGAVTHQALSIGRPYAGARTTFFQRVRAVRAESYTNAVAASYLLNFILGAYLYTTYRVEVRPVLEDAGLFLIAGMFEAKEHFAALGLGLLPAYWLLWKTDAFADNRLPRLMLTLLLASLVWWNFLAGAIVNNVRGL